MALLLPGFLLKCVFEEFTPLLKTLASLAKGGSGSSLGIALPRETHCDSVSVVTAEGRGHFWQMVWMQMNILWSVRPSHTIKDLSTLNITVPLMRDTVLGRKATLPCGILLLLPPLVPQPPARPALSAAGCASLCPCM